MKRAKRNRALNVRYIIILLMTFIVSVGVSYFYFVGKFTFDSSFINELGSKKTETEQKEQASEIQRLYHHGDSAALDNGDTNGDTSASLPAAEDAIRKYLDIYKVRLLDLYKDRQGVMYIDCGDELKKNFKGDAHEELNFVSGLYKTLVPVVADLTAVKILIGGRETDTLGGHIDISRPIGKEIAEDI